MALSYQYNFASLGGIDDYTFQLCDKIVLNLDNTEEALKVLEESDFMHYQQWIVVSGLVSDNPRCPRLFHLRHEFVKAVKALPEEERRECLSMIECRLNDQERRLWKVEDTDLGSLLNLALVLVLAICVSLWIYSPTEFLGNKAEQVFLGVFLIFMVLLALASCCFQMFKRRQSMTTLDWYDFV